MTTPRTKTLGEAKNSGSGVPSLAVEEIVEELKADGLKKARDYKILGTVGKGKFAVVYKGEKAGKTYAVKKVQIFEMLNAKSRDKCLKEVRLLQGMNHPNIIHYEDGYIDPDTNELVIVLEWAQGGDMKNLIRKVKQSQRAFSERQIWKYCSEIAQGLLHMHEKRVMHRDLKPANIMLSSDNHVKLADLGLSRYFTEQTMEAFSKVGTPFYMGPEVLLGEGYGFTADIWSLGCILYELCTLRTPFKPDQGDSLFGNVKPTTGGLIYGNYLLSHNVNPETYPNKPKTRQSYLSKRPALGWFVQLAKLT